MGRFYAPKTYVIIDYYLKKEHEYVLLSEPSVSKIYFDERAFRKIEVHIFEAIHVLNNFGASQYVNFV